ncbi:MAG: hypothetical protein AAFU49_12925 [Pseudomonadota bacterium]
MSGTIEAFFVYLLNGLTFEFGDDLLCWAGQELGRGPINACRSEMIRWSARLAEDHAYAAFAGTLIGYAITPLSGLLALIAGKPKSAGQAFGRGLGLELVEGGLSVIGQLVTDPTMGTALWSLGLSAVIAPVRGIVAAFTYSWVSSGVFRFLIVLILLAGLAILFDGLGLLPH